MAMTERVPDRSIEKKVGQRLARSGLGTQCRLTVTVRNGTVTIGGQLQYEIQRRQAMRAVGGALGVRMIVDRMQVKPASHHHH